VADEPGTSAAQSFTERLFNQGELSLIDERVAEDVILRTPATPTGRGRDAYRAAVTRLLIAFTDFTIQVDETFEAGGLVAVRGEVAGTHTGEFLGQAPTGRRFRTAWLSVSRLQDGLIQESWLMWDTLAVATQLGLVTRAGPPARPTAYAPEP
jgi:steroid delta-isomerase-like uncharacterized protein